MVNEQINIGIQVGLLAVTDPPGNYEVVLFSRNFPRTAHEARQRWEEPLSIHPAAMTG